MSFEINIFGELIWTNEKGDWHREKGPALICPNGHIEYHFNGNCHRLDGPAVIYSDGSKYYYIYDHKYGKEEYYSTIKDL